MSPPLSSLQHVAIIAGSLSVLSAHAAMDPLWALSPLSIFILVFVSTLPAQHRERPFCTPPLSFFMSLSSRVRLSLSSQLLNTQLSTSLLEPSHPYLPTRTCKHPVNIAARVVLLSPPLCLFVCSRGVRLSVFSAYATMDPPWSPLTPIYLLVFVSILSAQQPEARLHSTPVPLLCVSILAQLRTRPPWRPFSPIYLPTGL